MFPSLLPPRLALRMRATFTVSQPTPTVRLRMFKCSTYSFISRSANPFTPRATSLKQQREQPSESKRASNASTARAREKRSAKKFERKCRCMAVGKDEQSGSALSKSSCASQLTHRHRCTQGALPERCRHCWQQQQRPVPFSFLLQLFCLSCASCVFSSHFCPCFCSLQRPPSVCA